MKILSLGFHKGALNSIESVLKGYDVTTLFLPLNPEGYYYNMTSELADKLWKENCAYYNLFDCIITSDTAPLSRIFLQNNFAGKLIIWVCNRFDYADLSGPTSFPDKEYYELMASISSRKNVRIVAYTPFDQIYAIQKGVYVEDVIRPAFQPINLELPRKSYYIPDYQNNYNLDLPSRVKLPIVTGRHSGFYDLAKFKAIIHLPYHWHGIANDEALSVCTPYYVPTKRLFFTLLKSGKYWFQNQEQCEGFIDVCDFYDKNNSDFMFYFDDMNDIQEIQPDYNKIYSVAQDYYNTSRQKWIRLLEYS